jgi:outer membrane protein
MTESQRSRQKGRPPVRTRVVRLLLATAVGASGVVGGAVWTTSPLAAQGVGGASIDLTLERMVELGLRDSYSVRQLRLGIERTRSLLRAEQAGLRSRVELEVTAPQFQSLSEHRWNSTLQRNELVYDQSRRWEVELSVRQPVIVFGVPTNGYLSLNNRMYRYVQIEEDERDVRYYNRYFVAYEQPLFQPNEMRNDLVRAELGLERAELEFQGDVVEMIEELADDYFELFEIAYEGELAAELIRDLEAAAEAARRLAELDPQRGIDVDQLRVALANAREDQQEAESNYRLNVSEIKQRLRLNPADVLTVRPEVEVRALRIDEQRALEYAMSLAPRLRRLEMELQESELELQETRGRNGFRVNVELTYGREVQDPRFGALWTEPRNSYTINVDAYLPLWDWGQRDHRIAAEEFALRRTELEAEEARSSLENDVRNEIQRVEEYQQRALNMQDNLTLARQITDQALTRYAAGEITLVDVLQTVQRESQTGENFLDTYLGYREALLRLQQLTFYDFLHDSPLLERFTIDW